MEIVLPFLIGGLILFLYAISSLSSVLKKAFSDRAAKVISRYTSNIFLGLLIGAITTIVLNSSSAVIILVIIFINSKALTLKNAVGIIMGANIGTTFSSQLYSLDISQYAVLPMALGLILELFFKPRTGRAGSILFFLGLLFFGFYLLEQSVLPLKDSEVFLGWMAQIGSDHHYGALIGGLVTLLIQTSSGTVAMAIVLGKQHLITSGAGIAIMLGAELGTCSDTLLATINGTRQAIKAGVFHVTFNLITIIIGLSFFNQFLSLVDFFTLNKDISNQIANAHVLFNVLGVLIFLPFVKVFLSLLNKVIPEKVQKSN